MKEELVSLMAVAEYKSNPFFNAALLHANFVPRSCIASLVFPLASSRSSNVNAKSCSLGD